MARADLQSTIEELEHSNEELKVSNEEIRSMNEELKSTNESLEASNEQIITVNEELHSANQELEASRAELRSLNEELRTVNNQLQAKVKELASANNDMANLHNCTDVATVFLDRAFRIKLITPAAAKLFRVIPADVGRPLGDITAHFHDPDLLRDAQQVLQRLTPREKEVSTAEGVWWVRRITVYRTQDNRIDGVVITFVDITERKKAADTVVRHLAAIVENSVDAIFSKNLDGIIQTWNRGAERLYGYTAEEAVGQSVRMLVPEDRIDEWDSIMQRLRRGESVERLESERVRKDGQPIPVALTISPLRDHRGKVVSASTIARDISASKRADQALRDQEERLRALLDTAADAILTIDRNGIIQTVNPATEHLFGYTAAEMIGRTVKMLMPSPYREEHDDYLARYLQTGEKHLIGIGREVEARRKDGSIFPIDLAVSEIKHLQLFTGIIRDITRRRELECEVVEIASLEQRRIGHDLHDCLGQELIALNLLAKDLVDTLQTDPAKAPNLTEKMIHGLRRGQKELRAVLRGLIPVEVDTKGLMAALADLADHTQRENKVACVFGCPSPVSVADNLTATHLYLIAREAIRNAVKHARPRTIRIHLESKRVLILRVQDDGIGIRATKAVERAKQSGLGLRIMRNRAAIIGAKLTIEPAESAGTLVTCVLARKGNESQTNQEESPRADRR
jgi:PAS domain S-box-containing protein